MVCLDTDILVGLLRGDTKAVDKIKTLEQMNVKLSTTPINACELFKGAYKSRHSEENIELVQNTLGSLELLEFNVECSKKAGEIIESLHVEGKPISEFDVMIGSIALTHTEVLITRNVKHFKNIEYLRTEKW